MILELHQTFAFSSALSLALMTWNSPLSEISLLWSPCIHNQQSEMSVLKKFVRYIQCNPTPLALLMIKIKDNFSKPLSSPDLVTIRHCMNEEVSQ
jgi:hypothetical protein